MANIQPANVKANQPTPEKGIFSYPTPKVTDTIVREIVDSWGTPYEPLTYGTLYNAVGHTSYAISLPEHQLAYQGPSPGDPSGQWVQRIWVNPRANSDSYNYSQKYADEDPDYPIIVRTKVVKRDEYEPLPPLTPDAENPDNLLVSQEMLNQTDPPEINSLYVTVVEVYERIPGPVVTTADFDTELNIMVYTDRQSILSTNTANPSTNPLILELRETPRSKYTKQRITSYLLQLPATRIEYQTGRYPFPSLLLGVTANTIFLTDDPDSGTTRSEVRWTPNLREAPDAPAKFRVTTSFHTSEPSGVTIYILGKKNVIFRGISYQYSFNSVLTDNFTTSIAFSGDSRYGNMSENFSVTASVPSATDYLTSVAGTYRIVGANIKQWRGAIWVKSVQEVLMI